MANVIDPLKMRTYGEKKSVQEKQEKIQGLYDKYHRYYPVDNRGNLDEWGAVIKHQEEMYKNEVERKKIEKANIQK